MMKAITLWQPWASLIVNGDKLIETRTRPTNVRGTVAIHAAKADHSHILDALHHRLYRYFQQAKVTDRHLPHGAILGTVDIVGCKPLEELLMTSYGTEQEQAFGDWGPGRYGWILANPVAFDKPILAKGAQGFWNWEDTL